MKDSAPDSLSPQCLHEAREANCGAPYRESAEPFFTGYLREQLHKFRNDSGNREIGAPKNAPENTNPNALRDRWLARVEQATGAFRARRAEWLMHRSAQIAGCESALRQGLDDCEGPADREQVLRTALESFQGRTVAAEAVTAEGWRYCPLAPWDSRDRQPEEHWVENPMQVRPGRSRWHETRAQACLERFDRVRSCGSHRLRTACGDCGTVERDVRLRCDDHKLCLHCRTARIRKYQERFRKAHLEKERQVKALGYHRPLSRHGYRWSARFLTLTLPHGPSIPADMAELQRAWPRFWQRVQQHLIKDRKVALTAVKRVSWVRVLEVTPGRYSRDEQEQAGWSKGHAHLHVYLYGPYLSRDVLQLYWARSLSESYREQLPYRDRGEVLGRIEDPRKREHVASALVTRRGGRGRALATVPQPVIDLRRCHGSAKDISRELAKYLVKDGERRADTGELVHAEPEWFASVYEALCSRRSICASRGFWLLRLPQPKCAICTCCGGFTRSEILESDQPRGPPSATHES